MAKGTSKKASSAIAKESKKTTSIKEPNKAATPQKLKQTSTKKTASAEPKKEAKKPPSQKSPRPVKKSVAVEPKNELKKPSLRAVYSNSKNTLLPLGFGSDFKTKKCVVIFSDLSNGQVHTTALSVWNRMKLKEVKDVNL